MDLRLHYGADWMEGAIDFSRCLGTLDIADPPSSGEAIDIRAAIESPIGLDQNIFQMVRPGETAAIIVSDSFRRTRVCDVLPALLDGLDEAGIPDEAIRFIFATGTHRGPTPEEQAEILGTGIRARFQDRIVVHDPHDAAQMTQVGVTSRGTPVAVNRAAVECDRIIATGAVVMHYFGGFGGGRKSILPGIASVESIAHNHAMNLHPTEDRLDPAVRIGATDGNPVAEDMLEAARMVGVDYIINTVLDRNGKIAGLFAGELDAAHQAAAAFARDLFSVHIPERADLVIASSGATRNYVQSHKALYNSYQAVKPNGRIILLARCEEGLGGEQFVKWVRLGTRDAIIAGLRANSEINGQTALSTVGKTPITLMVTDLSDEDVAILGARKAADIEEALRLARADLEAAGVTDPTYYVMPSAAYAVPFLSS